ncbi:PREDICTED: uncharacterized protein LOC109391166 [Hipposideros armiger]|uniref:Uncharacterized protein LOC109391166 n=1 Tax=Hipposideros armiger TaxID=186990 RepID=A0A8B7SNR1_HIPAR|nr:PREDICTED: uncharacterized protein LOC109391166 [Hipposideros armiger]
MTGQSPSLLPPWHPCVLEEPPPGWAVRPQPGTRSAVILKPCQGVSTAFEGTHPCLPGRMPGGLFLLHLCGPLRPGRHPRGRRTTGKAPSPCWPSLGTVCPPFPPLLVLCAEGGGAAPAPSLFLLPLLWACQECREIRGRGHRKCLHPSKDSSSCKWRELGEGRGRRKVVPPPRPARTSQPCRQKGSFSPALAHCECPLRGDAEGRSPVVSLAQAGLREARCRSCSLNAGSLQSRLSGDPAPEPLRKQVRSGGLSLLPPRGAPVRANLSPFSGGHPACHPHQGRASAYPGLCAGACFPGTTARQTVQDGKQSRMVLPAFSPLRCCGLAPSWWLLPEVSWGGRVM